MTTMLIDNKANVKPAYEYFSIDTNEYRTLEDLKALAVDCMNENVYLIKVFYGDTKLFEIRNEK